MSGKDKKATRAALRDFLVAVPDTFARATGALRGLVVLGAVALALGIILEDMMVVIIGVVVGSAGILLSVTLGAALFHLLRGLF